MEGTTAGRDAQERLLRVVQQQTAPVLSEQIERALSTVNSRARTSGPLGFLVLLVTSIAIFMQFESAFDKIWSIPPDRRKTWQIWVRDSLVIRLRALAILVGVGLFVILVIVISLVWATLQTTLTIPDQDLAALRWVFTVPANVGLNCLAFTCIYRLIPKEKLQWRDAIHAGAVAALLWEVGRQLLNAYLVRGNFLSAYGIIGSFLAIMLWTYYAMMIIFFGAEYVKVIGQEKS